MPGRPDEPRGGHRDREGDLSGRGRVRRHVHRQHDGERGRGAGSVAARQRGAARTRLAPGRLRRAFGRGRGQAGGRRHHRAHDPDEEGVRERDHRRHGAGRFDQRGAAPAGDRARGQGRADAGRLQPHRRQGAAPRGRQAVRPLRDDRHRRDRRRAGGDEGAAGRRVAARRLPDGHRQDDRGEPGRHRTARPGRQDHPRDEQPDPPHRRADDPARLAGAGRRRGQERRPGRRLLRGHRARLRQGAGGDGCAGRRPAAGRRRRGDPLGGAEGRPGHARDARDHRGDQGRRAGQGRAADHRRPVLGRDDRPVHRARGARGGARWPDRAGAGG